ncbi:FAD-dependent monooxygenase [Streptomyces sp. NPDC090022]|uniref:FAD-dependent monooxygenase n=1 Tax=Streptomyces sp. NPDC090022 TaxID=3365920 RepID=UPI00382F4645
MPSALLAAATRTHRATLTHKLAEVAVRYDGRTVLIGDAAHPVGAGQGASMAIEDAVTLARCVATAPSVPAALTAYDALRRPRSPGRSARRPATATRRPRARCAAACTRPYSPLALRYGYERSTRRLCTHEVIPLPTPPA